MVEPNPYSSSQSANPDFENSATKAYDSRLGWGFAVTCVLTIFLALTLVIGFRVYWRAWIASVVGLVCLACSTITVRRGGWGCAVPVLIVTFLIVAIAWSMTPVWCQHFGFGCYNEYDAR